MPIVKSILVFILAGFCEIDGGYLVWLWLEKAGLSGMELGGVILATYGIVATLQPANFGRVYITYGGVFIVVSLLRGWKVDQFMPDHYDIIGVLVVLVGVAIIFYAPRN